MPELLTGAAPELDARVTAFVAEHRLPGAMAGVIAGGGLAWSAGAGFADVARRRAPDPATLYRIASITKTFTATATGGRYWGCTPPRSGRTTRITSSGWSGATGSSRSWTRPSPPGAPCWSPRASRTCSWSGLGTGSRVSWCASGGGPTAG